MSQPLLPKSFDASLLSLGAVKTLESGGKSIFVAYDGNPFIIQTPKMSLPFGVSMFDEKNSKLQNVSKNTNNKYSLEMAFKDMDTKPGVAKFYEMIESIDNYIKSKALDNSLTWFNKKKISEEVSTDMYTHGLKHYIENGERTNKYPSRIKLSVPMDKDGKFTCKAYTSKNQMIELTQENTKNCEAQCIIRCQGIWIINGKYGVTYKLEQILLTPRTQGLESFAFALDPDEVTNTIESKAVPEEMSDESSVADDDDDDDDDDLNRAC